MSKKISAELNTALRAASSAFPEGIEVKVEDDADVDDVVEDERRIRLSGRSGEADDRRLGLDSGSILYNN